MLAVTREMLLEHLLEISALTDKYASREPDFIESTMAWLAACEATLQRIRSPLAGMIASERAKILASHDGYREPGATREQGKPRKAVRATAYLAIARAEAELRAAVVAIDERLLPLREKMAQLIAVSSAAQPLPMPEGAERDQWLSAVWQILKQSKEGRSMAVYLSTTMQTDDLWLILGEMLDNLLGAMASGSN